MHVTSIFTNIPYNVVKKRNFPDALKQALKGKLNYEPV